MYGTILEMITPTVRKQETGTQMKKRYIILAIACVEIAALPAAAQKFGAFDFTMPSVVAASKLPTPMQEKGAQRFLVTSDGPFSITSEGAASDFELIWVKSGSMGNFHFGKHAKLPGEVYSCAKSNTIDKTIIYDAAQATYDQDGEVVDQAVLVEIRFNPDLAPKFKFVSDKRTKKLPRAEACPNQPS